MTDAGQKAFRRILCLAAAVATGVLTAAGFAPWESVTASWGCLVPLLLVCRFRPPRESFGWGFLAGSITWLTGLHWLTALSHTAGLHPALTTAGWVLVSLYCALYTGAFAWTVSRWLAWTGTGRLIRNCASVLVIPVFWVGLEYLRAVLFTGFLWNPLGVAQAQNPAIAQAAEWGGVFLVSGVIVLFNTSVAFTLGRYLDREAWRRYRPHAELFMGLTVMAVCTVWGRARFQQVGALGGHVLVGLVQPAVDQAVKWDAAFANEVQNRLETLTFDARDTALALAGRRPDLTIWPETCTPGDLREDAELQARVTRLAETCGPLLAGTLWEDENGALFNRSILIGTNGAQDRFYDKQHRVPFGEFIPFDKPFPALQRLSPLGISLSPGREATVFDLPERNARFSVTICFEDIFPDLSREFVRRGARLLINQSNDAWFDGTAQHRQHLNMGVMRCIENRVPGVRVSNSGISACIEANGRIYRTGLSRSSDEGWLGATGPLPDETQASDVSLLDCPPPSMALTAYTRHGDWLLAIPCAWAVLVWAAAALWMDRRRNAVPASGARND